MVLWVFQSKSGLWWHFRNCLGILLREFSLLLLFCHLCVLKSFYSPWRMPWASGLQTWSSALVEWLMRHKMWVKRSCGWCHHKVWISVKECGVVQYSAQVCWLSLCFTCISCVLVDRLGPMSLVQYMWWHKCFVHGFWYRQVWCVVSCVEVGKGSIAGKCRGFYVPRLLLRSVIWLLYSVCAADWVAVIAVMMFMYLLDFHRGWRFRQLDSFVIAKVICFIEGKRETVLDCGIVSS